MQVINDLPACVGLGLVFIDPINLLNSIGTLDEHPVVLSC